MNPPPTSESRASDDRFNRLLSMAKRAGLSLTTQRRLVLQILCESVDHPDVEVIHQRASAQDPRLSLATAYRTVKLFQDAGLIMRHEFGDNRARYEVIKRHHHDHLIDIDHGDVIEFHDDKIEELQEQVAERLGYELLDRRLDLYGRRLEANHKPKLFYDQPLSGSGGSFGPERYQKTAGLVDLARKRGVQLAFAESCTGGLFAAALTEVPGASDIFIGGFVTYSNQAKIKTLGVDPALIDKHGAVSAPVAKAMAAGCRKITGADVTLAVTGVAGPSASEKKPVGLVFTGIDVAPSLSDSSHVVKCQFSGPTRQQVRLQTLDHGLDVLWDILSA